MVETTYKLNTPVSLALLADLHGRDPAPVLSSLTAHCPDLICIAGDFVYGVWPEGNVSPLISQPNVLPFLRGCADLAPTFLSLGNHEQMMDETDEKMIKRAGVTVLDNDWCVINGVVIGGLTSAYVTDYRRNAEGRRSRENRYPQRHGMKVELTPDISWLPDFCSAPGFHILLSHHPEYWLEVREKKIELMLSGHAHGGQWAYYSFKRKRMCGLFAPGQGWFPLYTKGVYEGRLVVSAGLSNTAPVPRFFNPTEIVYLESR